MDSSNIRQNSSNSVKEIQTDFLVVGASVAGSTIAKELAAYGKTIFTDRHLPGSVMNCGGGMPEKTFMSLGLDIPYLRIKKAEIDINSKSYPFPLNYVIVHRSEFDRALYERAEKAGAEFLKLNYRSHNPKECTALFLDENNKKVKISFKKLILAYGFHPRCEPFSGKKRKLTFGAAIVEIIDTKSPYADELFFTILKGSPGYTWLFPMPGGTINIGTGTMSTFEILREEYKNFKKKLGVDKKVIVKGGGVFPLFTRIIISKGPVVLFGDCAGMINALNGEGIQHICAAAKKLAPAIAGNKNVNLKWFFSKTYILLSICGVFFTFMRFFEEYLKIPLYTWTSKLVTKIRRMKG